MAEGNTRPKNEEERRALAHANAVLLAPFRGDLSKLGLLELIPGIPQVVFRKEFLKAAKGARSANAAAEIISYLGIFQRRGETGHDFPFVDFKLSRQKQESLALALSDAAGEVDRLVLPGWQVFARILSEGEFLFGDGVHFAGFEIEIGRGRIVGYFERFENRVELCSSCHGKGKFSADSAQSDRRLLRHAALRGKRGVRRGLCRSSLPRCPWT